MKFILPFLFSLVISAVAIYFLLWGYPKIQHLRKLRGLDSRRVGGIFVIATFGLVVILDRNLAITKPIIGILAGGVLILFLGLLDDWKNLSWRWQLVFQIIIAIVAIYFGVRSSYVANPFGGIILLTNPIIYFTIYTLYFLLFLNALNWLDGVDGLAGGVTLASLGTIFLLSFKPEVNQPAIAILCAIAGGAVVGFLVFNFFPSKILAGTSGAWFFGFILASFSIFAGAKIATVMTAALIPILDFGRVIWERWRAGQSIFQRDERHLHYLLMKGGLSERKIFFLYFLTSFAIGIFALNLKGWEKLVIVIMVGFLYFVLREKIKS